jgi:hypothetical protein
VKKVLGLTLMAAGLLVVVVEAMWTTGEKRDIPVLPPLGENVLVFVLGLTGLALVYGGYRLVRGS